MEKNNKQLLSQFQSSWAKNKYWVMSRSQQAYNDIRWMAKGNQWTEEKQRIYEHMISDLEQVSPTDKTLRVAFQHIWGYFKKIATPKEKEIYNELIETSPLKSSELESFLKELSNHYQQPYLIKMRWGLSVCSPK